MGSELIFRKLVRYATKDKRTTPLVTDLRGAPELKCGVEPRVRIDDSRVAVESPGGALLWRCLGSRWCRAAGWYDSLGGAMMPGVVREFGRRVRVF